MQHQLAAIKQKTDSIDDMRDQMHIMQSMLSTVPSGLVSGAVTSRGGSLTDLAAGGALHGESIGPLAARVAPQGVCSSDTGVRTNSTEDVELVELTGPDSLTATPSAPHEPPSGFMQPFVQAATASTVPVRVMAPAARALTPTSAVHAESARLVRGRHDLASPRPDQPTGRPAVTLVHAGPSASPTGRPARPIVSPPRSPLARHRITGAGSPVPSPVLQYRTTGADSPSRDAGDQRFRHRSGSGSRSRPVPEAASAAHSAFYCGTAPGTVQSSPVLRHRGNNAGSRFSSPMPSARAAVVEGAATQPSFTAFSQASTGGAPLSPMSMARVVPTGSPVTFVNASGSTSSLHALQAGQPTVRQAQSASQTPSATPRVTWIMPQGR